jgi:hypothetical protein
LAILGQKSLDRFGNTFPFQIKNYSPFLSQRVKQSNEKNHTTITPPQSLKSTRVNRVIISTDKKRSKILIDRKLEKSLQVDQKRGT